MSTMKKHFELLGRRATDKVTGFKGVVSSLTFDLYGCIQALVTPSMDKDGKIQDSNWFDVNRLSVDDPSPVMALPNFDFGPQANGEKGPADKPRHSRA